MKVHLEAHVFKSSFADLMKLYEQGLYLEEFKGCAATVQFVHVVDAAFDATAETRLQSLKPKSVLRPS